MEKPMRMDDKFRIGGYHHLAAGLVVLYVFLKFLDWDYSNIQLYKETETVSTILAIITGMLAIVRFYAMRHNMILFRAVGFIGKAYLDRYNAIVTSRPIMPFLPSEDYSPIQWNWNASRSFLATIRVKKKKQDSFVLVLKSSDGDKVARKECRGQFLKLIGVLDHYWGIVKFPKPNVYLERD